MLKKLILLTLCFTLLTACMPKEPIATPIVQTGQSWQQRQDALAQLTQWHTMGALAIQTPKGTDSMQFDWQLQSQNQYSLRFIGPVGTGYGTLKTTPGQSVYLAPKGKVYQDSNANALLTQVTGWRLPVDDLYYWMRGLPAPDSAAALQFAEDNSHLISLQQDGFQVLFQRYTGVGTLDLPSKILLQRQDLKVKIVITRWQ
jgi:outer membrane lipoprotein LolB